MTVRFLYQLPNFILIEDFTKHKTFVKLQFTREDLLDEIDSLLFTCVAAIKATTGLDDDFALKCINYSSQCVLLFFFENMKDAEVFFDNGLAIMNKNREYFNWTIEDENGIINSNT